MLLFFTSLLLVVQAVCEATLAPPQNIHVEGGLLTWTPATEDTELHYTVQYRSFDSAWKNVTACVHTSSNSCNVTFIKAKSTDGCVTLRVQVERDGLISRAVEACSKHGDSCSPEMSLAARPGSLTVYINVSHSLVEEHGGHVKHRVYYGKEGESLEENYQDGVSSVSIHGLEQGQNYCIKAQYLLFNRVTGLASCIQCEIIPKSGKESRLTELTVGVVVVVLLAILIPVIAYILIFHGKKIKVYLQPPYYISEHFFYIPPLHEQLPSSSSEEHYSPVHVVPCKTPEENECSCSTSHIETCSSSPRSLALC